MRGRDRASGQQQRQALATAPCTRASERPPPAPAPNAPGHASDSRQSGSRELQKRQYFSSLRAGEREGDRGGSVVVWRNCADILILTLECRDVHTVSEPDAAPSPLAGALEAPAAEADGVDRSRAFARHQLAQPGVGARKVVKANPARLVLVQHNCSVGVAFIRLHAVAVRETEAASHRCV